MSGVNFSTLVRANANFSKPINHVQPLLAADNLRHIRIRGDESVHLESVREDLVTARRRSERGEGKLKAIVVTAVIFVCNLLRGQNRARLR